MEIKIFKRVKGYKGTKIAFYDEGIKDAPTLLFIHGFSQSSMSWKYQRESFLKEHFRLVSIDIRGHGSSDKPQTKESYDNYIPFAHDLEAVIKNINSEKIIPICWSMGGNWICDYIRKYGADKLQGIILVGATTQQGTKVTENFFGSGATNNLDGLFNSDLSKSIVATKNFIKACSFSEIKKSDFEEILSFNMIVTPEIRMWMLGRVSDNNDILKKINVPVLQIHGDKDCIVLPLAGEYTIEKISNDNKEFKLYKQTGHSPFLESPNKFNEDIYLFSEKVFNS